MSTTRMASTSFPHIRDIVPERLKPWLYVFIACCFQLSGGRYAGSIGALTGVHGDMREDMMMCVYANLSGMAVWFPMLFRMKFRFPNKTLLLCASATVLLMNVLTMYVASLPLLWLCCFVAGMAKIQGTFECMSNIQLWLTPTRSMRVFFPCLHVIVLSAVAFQTLLSAWFGWLGCWQLMHWFVIGLQTVVLLLLVCFWDKWLMPCTPMGERTPIRLKGIDWSGCLLWGGLLIETALLLDYGEFNDWYNGDMTWVMSGLILITIGLILAGMCSDTKSYISPNVFCKFRYVKSIFILIVLYEAIWGAEHVLEELFKEGVLGYDMLTSSRPTWLVWFGNMAGCWFSWWWMKHVRQYTYIRLGIIGTVAVLLYVVLMYFHVGQVFSIEMLYAPSFCRGFSYACMSIMFMTALYDLMDFEHFFMGMMVFNSLHMVIGGCIGSAIYGHLVRYYSSDALARSLNPLLLQGAGSAELLCVSIKQIYGCVAFVCVALLLGFLCFDSPLRRDRRYFGH